MHRTLDRSTVVERLTAMTRRDRKRRVFGANGHDYGLNPPVPVAVIEAFEERHGVRLPEDYRLFLTEIGDGGAGPHYGVLRFGKDDDERDWDGGGLVGDLSRPFPHTSAWNLPDSFWRGEPDWPPDTPIEEQDRLMEAWDRELEAHYWNPSVMDGAIPICHKGCALRQWLVIQGDQRGYIWDDHRVDNAGIAPVLSEVGEQVTFADWYMDWLDASLAGEDDHPLPTPASVWRRGWRAFRRRSGGGSMKPIRFACDETLASPPEQIARQILDLSLWPEFRGYGVLPGIKSAGFERQTPEIVGTRIRVTNTDGSTHTEEIVEWEPERRVKLRMGDFSPPLSRLATGFDETWEFTADGSMTRAVRSFELHPKSPWSRPVLWLISILLERAIARHMRQMKAAGGGAAP